MTPWVRIAADLSPEDRAAFREFCERAYVSLEHDEELQAARETWVTWDRPDLPLAPRMQLVIQPPSWSGASAE